jgi:hypothetical protein
MTCIDIIRQYLRDHGYDGLAGEDCGCAIDDLAPCDEGCNHCNPAFAFRAKDLKDGEYECYYEQDEIVYCATVAPKCPICGKGIDIDRPSTFWSLDEPTPRRRVHVNCAVKAGLATVSGRLYAYEIKE